LTSRLSVSLSSAAAAAAAFFFLPALFFSEVEPGVGASEAAFFSLLANEVDAGVGAAGVEAPETGVSAAAC